MDHPESLKFSYQLLRTFTKDFSEVLGSGSFGTVYKGTHANGDAIAVKVLNDMAALDEKNFTNEFENLVRFKHENIVKLMGYCNESEEEIVNLANGTEVTAQRLHVALCLEYVDNGNLGDRISDENQGLEWPIRYKIIKGICDGLKHLREGLEEAVWHLDLKPANILLDKKMTPKIADFGLSRLIGEERTKKTMTKVGTLRYCPPEYMQLQLVSEAFDIFSLGVIITKIMIGANGYYDCADMPHRNLIKHVHNIWKKRLQEIVRPKSLDVCCQQVKKCIEIASKCLNQDRKQRPSIQEIIVTLNDTETRIHDITFQKEQIGAVKLEDIITQRTGRTTHMWCQRNYHIVSSKKITNDFSQELGYGISGLDISYEERNEFIDFDYGSRMCSREDAGSGVFYKGVNEDGQVIVVKVLEVLYNKQFTTEIENMAKAQHENIIRLVGYCNEHEQVVVELGNGKNIIASRSHNALCFEYTPNGSLEWHLSGLSDGLDWCKYYKIIKGICEGLRYLHEGLPSPVVHLDLRPSNILLDKNMVPKISGFHLSRQVEWTVPPDRTIKYLPPEYIKLQIISEKLDIYSLGVIILEIMTGSLIPSTRHFSYTKVLEKWRKWLQESLSGCLREQYCQQVVKCVEIALKCVEENRHKRPDIGDIISMLDETETWIPGSLLDVYPHELCFPFKLRKHGSCLLQLRNKKNDPVSFMLDSKTPRRYLTKLPLSGVVPPKRTYTLTLTTIKQQQQPPSSDNSEGFVLQSIVESHHWKQGLLDQYYPWIGGCDIHSEQAQSDNLQNMAGDEVQPVVEEVTLNSFCVPLAEEGSSKLNWPEIMIIVSLNAQEVSSIEVHPTEPWIMTTHQRGDMRVWNYETLQEVLNLFEVIDEPVYAAKFIAQEEWIVAGDGNGCIHVYSYDGSHDATSFEAHNGRIMSLAVHPTDSYMLSSSHNDHIIKLWHWDPYWDFKKGSWVYTRNLQGHSDIVPQSIFNKEGTGSFASASWDCTVKVWDLTSDECNSITLDKHSDSLVCVEYIAGPDHQHLITGSKDGTAQIWDLETKSCRQKLEGHANYITSVYCHPELKKLITGSLDGTVRIWDIIMHRLENIIAFNLGAVYDFRYIEELQRIIVGCDRGIAMLRLPLFEDHGSLQAIS